MHFENSIGDADSRTVSLYYRVALSIFGIPVEYILICILAGVIVLTITFGIILLTSKERKPKPQVNPSYPGRKSEASKDSMMKETQIKHLGNIAIIGEARAYGSILFHDFLNHSRHSFLFALLNLISAREKVTQTRFYHFFELLSERKHRFISRSHRHG